MTGIDLLRDPLRNRGTAFTLEERERLGLAGLLPPRVETIGEQVARVLAALRGQPSPMARFT
ncbi:MAG TPA: NAD-dependent malic enzyme, partial [Burkholderiales bacterium]|nr:NAD-dependent malic enzyme [Burkholderiales bacterium]